MIGPATLREARMLGMAAALALLLPFGARPQAGAAFQIAGQVVNAVTGDPVPRATVSALSVDDNRVVATVIADAEGKFSFSGLPAGKYPLTASRRGFRTALYDEHEETFNTAIVTGPDQNTQHLIFSLAPGAVIFGTVTADGGDPVQNANVVLFRGNPAAPARNPTQMQNVTTDDIGEYEFSDLPAGEYFIAVGAQPWYATHSPADTADAAENSLDVAYPITFYDSTTDEGAASPIEVASGDRAQANVALHAVPALHIKLVGLGPHNGSPMPVSNLRQSVFGADFPAQAEVQGVADSIEFVGLAPGHYQLETTNPPRTMDLDASSSMDVDPASGTPSQPVDGTLRMTGGSPPGDVMLTLVQPNSAGLSTDARNGQFHFAAVPPGAWTLSAANARGSLYVAAVSSSSGPVAGSQITVRDRPVSLAVTLTPSQASITGFARMAGKPAPGAMIVLVPRDPAAWPALARRDQSDSDGSFSLPNVPPGSYTVVAIADGWKLDWQDPSVMARYLPGGESVTIGTQPGGVVPLSRPVEAASP